MSASQKKVIDNHCTGEWAAKVAGPWADFEHNGIDKIKAMPGHEVYEPPRRSSPNGRRPPLRSRPSGPRASRRPVSIPI